MTVRMEEDQILTSIMRMGAIPMRQCEGLLALEDLSAERTASCLLLQEWCTPCRGRLHCPLSISILTGGLPVGVEWVGVALDLHMTLGFDRCWSTDELCAGRWISQAPGCARLLGKGALDNPASRVVRVTECGPAREPSPDETIPWRTRLATEAVAVGVRPAPEDGVAWIDELCRCPAGGLLTEGCALRCDGLSTGLPGRNGPLGRFAMGSGIFAYGLPEEVKALREGGMTVLCGESRTPRAAKKVCIDGRTVSATTSRELAVTMKASAHRTSLLLWTRRCQVPPWTTPSRPSSTL